MEKKGNEIPGRLVLVPFPFQGHMTPMLQLGTILHSKGFAITIAHTKFNPPNPSNHPDLEFHPLPDNLSVSDTSNFITDTINIINRNCEAPLLELLEGHGGQVLAIIYDTLMHFSESVATRLKIPSLVLRSSSSSYLLAYLALPWLQAQGYLPFQVSMLQEVVPKLYPLRFKDLPLSSGTLEDTLKILETTSNIGSSSAIIWNAIDFLEHSSLSNLQLHYKVPFFPIGPFCKMAPALSTSLMEEDTSCIAWLNKQVANSVLYVSLGSVASIDAKELAETAWGLSNSGQPFLWVVRPGSVCGSKWIELLPEGFTEKVGKRGHIVKWAPQKDVLAHGAVGGFWSHCGWNSTLESICEGVPMICKPHFLDQKVNARYLSYVWKIGLELEHELERGDIERTIRRLLVGKEGIEIRQRATEMKQKVEACICEGGSSYNSLKDLAEFFVLVRQAK